MFSIDVNSSSPFCQEKRKEMKTIILYINLFNDMWRTCWQFHSICFIKYKTNKRTDVERICLDVLPERFTSGVVVWSTIEIFLESVSLFDRINLATKTLWEDVCIEFLNIRILVYFPRPFDSVLIIKLPSFVIGWLSIWWYQTNCGTGLPAYEQEIDVSPFDALINSVVAQSRKRGVNKTSRILVAFCSYLPIFLRNHEIKNNN